ncbi:MAG: MarR family transcriptional regulator [Fimbriimonadales bacterium]
MDYCRAERLGELFAQVVRICLSEALVERVTSAEVTYSQFETLHYVASHPLATIGDLSEGLNISYPSATNMAIRLSKKGLLQKRGVKTDKRVVRLGLTETGQELVKLITSERQMLITKLLNEMKEPERASFLKGMDSFVQIAVKSGACSPDRLCLACGTEAIDDCPLHVAGDFECK